MTKKIDIERKWKDAQRKKVVAIIMCAAGAGFFVYLLFVSLHYQNYRGAFLSGVGLIYALFCLILVLVLKISRERFEYFIKLKERQQHHLLPGFLRWHIKTWLGVSLLILIVVIFIYLLVKTGIYGEIPQP